MHVLRRECGRKPLLGVCARRSKVCPMSEILLKITITFTTSLHPCVPSLSFKGRQRTATRTLSVSFILLFSWNKNILILLSRPCCYRNEYVDIIAEITVEYINVFAIKTKKYQKQYQSLTNTSQNKLCLPAWCIFLFGSTGERVTEKKKFKGPFALLPT